MNEKDQARIEDYLYGRMSAEQAAAFEAEIDKDPALAEVVNLERLEKQALRLLSQDMLRAEMANWKAEKEHAGAAPAKVRTLPGRRLFYRLSAAAAILLLVGVPFWWANRHFSDAALTNGVLGLQTSVSDRGNIPSGSPLLPALERARTRDYEAAIEQLRQLQGTPYEGQARLMMGEIYTEQGNFSAAAEIYAGLADTSADAVVRQKAQWLLGNVYLASGRESEASALLEKIADEDGHLNQREARALLKELNSFWRKLAF
ncbi:MAG: tetratricopeptide repeat protein [Lewinellaceae bacterium]|nr:tetratricopeptide repeat protein [Lewinellaceae bacterium]